MVAVGVQIDVELEPDDTTKLTSHGAVALHGRLLGIVTVVVGVHKVEVELALVLVILLEIDVVLGQKLGGFDVPING